MSKKYGAILAAASPEVAHSEEQYLELLQIEEAAKKLLDLTMFLINAYSVTKVSG